MTTSRYELKFPITLQQKQAFMADAEASVSPDKHGVNAIYRVSSMYFDTNDLLAYWQKSDGEAVRRKYRLRYYTLASDGPIQILSAFMEIKHRIKDLVYKERVPITNEGAEIILSDPYRLSDLSEFVSVVSTPTMRSSIERIQRAASTSGFTAVNVITYMREAWEGEIDERLRLTFDSGCQAYDPEDYKFVCTNSGRKILADDEFIMEVKFDESIPRWIRDLVARHGIQLERFSKYAYGVERLEILEENHHLHRLTPFERAGQN